MRSHTLLQIFNDTTEKIWTIGTVGVRHANNDIITGQCGYLAIHKEVRNLGVAITVGRINTLENGISYLASIFVCFEIFVDVLLLISSKSNPDLRPRVETRTTR